MIYELRTYEAAPGKMPEQHARFRDDLLPIFERLEMPVVGLWTYAHGGWSDRLVYLMRFGDIAERDRKWAAFFADEEWHRIRAEGSLVTRIRSDILAPTDYSPLP
ncbi:MAG: NIPSNAP family protein [Chloroflexi bacterium]|nr:NIPSNAP family protein [Chloroflexota bacterium]